MQSLTDIKLKLGPSFHSKVDRWYLNFQSESKSTGIDSFVDYLENAGLLSDKEVGKLRGIPSTESPNSDENNSPPAKPKLDIGELETLSPEKLEDPPDPFSASLTDDSAPSPSEQPESENISNFFTEDTMAPPQPMISKVNLPKLPATPEQNGARVSYAQNIDLHPVTEEHKILEEIGKGAMGIVYLAREQLLGRKVALKQVRVDRKDDREANLRFLREAQITAQLDHPAVVPVYRLVKGYEDLPAYTMKVVEGQTLEEFIKETQEFYQKDQPPPESHSLGTRLEQFLKVCDGISYAHNKGVLHRDIKPKNILVGRYGVVYIVDWGLARLMFESDIEGEEAINIKNTSGFQSIRTEAGQMMGTPQYMSPEQAQGRVDDMDGRSDLYSLGIILFELVFLKPAIEGENLLDLVQRILGGRLNKMEHLSPQESVDQELKLIVAKATASHIEERYQAVEEMADDIRHYMRRATMPETTAATVEQEEPAVYAEEKSYTSRIFGLLLLCSLLSFGWYFLESRNKSNALLFSKESIHRLQEASQMAYKLQQRLTLYEGLVQQLGSAALIALQRQPDTEQPPLQLHKNFQPSDWKKSPFYKSKISLRWPVIQLQPSKEKTKKKRRRRRRRRRKKSKQPLLPKEFQKTFYQLVGLNRQLKHTFYGSLPTELEGQSLSQKNNVVRRSGFPILSTYIATKDGAISVYPGRKEFPKGYDPRTLDWFKQSQRSKRMIWTQHHISKQALRLVQISCLLPLFDKQQNLLAVVGIDLALNSLIQQMDQAHKSDKWIGKSFLVDSKTNVILKAGTRLPRFKGKLSNYSKQKLKPLNIKGLSAALSSKRASGIIRGKSTDGGYQLVTYNKLRSLPWTYITITETIK